MFEHRFTLKVNLVGVNWAHTERKCRVNSSSHLARCYLCVGVHWYSCLWNKFQADINKLCRVNHTLPRPRLLDELSKVLALGKYMHDSSSQAFLCCSGKNVSLIFGEKKRNTFIFSVWVFPLNSSQRWGCSAPSFSTSPPATHFNLINDPSPSTRLCFYRLLLKVDLLWPASLKRLLMWLRFDVYD